MPEIFISYRRDDSSGHAGRLFDCMRERFGDESVFMDITDIRPGSDFTTALDSALSSCRVVLVVIGTQWLTSADASGRRRLDDPGDHLRLEIAGALAHDAHVIPVLVRGATMPREADLPADLRPLARRQAQEVSDTRWSYDTEQLIRVVEADLATTGHTASIAIGQQTSGAGAGSRRLPKPLFWIAAAAAVLLVVLAARQWGSNRPTSASGQTSSTPGSATRSDRDSAAAGLSAEPSEAPIRLPAMAEARAGDAVFRVLGGLVSRAATAPRRVRFLVRTTNVGARYGLNVSPESFRLIAGGQATAPNEAPIEAIAMQSATEGWVVFTLASDSAAVVLQVGDVRRQTAKIPIDLRATEVNPTGKPALTWRQPVDLPIVSEKRAGGLSFQVKGARLEHFGDAVPPLEPEKLLLSFTLRIENVGAASGYPFSGDDFRLLVDEVPLAPTKTPVGLLSYQAGIDADVVFVIPGTATHTILQVGNLNGETAKIPVDLSGAH